MNRALCSQGFGQLGSCGLFSVQITDIWNVLLRETEKWNLVVREPKLISCFFPRVQCVVFHLSCFHFPSQRRKWRLTHCCRPEIVSQLNQIFVWLITISSFNLAFSEIIILLITSSLPCAAGQSVGMQPSLFGLVQTVQNNCWSRQFSLRKIKCKSAFSRSVHYKAQAAKHGGRRLDERWVAASPPNSSVLMENVAAVISLTQQLLVWRDNFVFFFHLVNGLLDVDAG